MATSRTRIKISRAAGCDSAAGPSSDGVGDGGGKDGGGEPADVYVPDRGRLPALLLAPHERRSRAQAGAGGGYRGARWQARRERSDRAGRSDEREQDTVP